MMAHVRLSDLELAERNLSSWLSGEHWRERVISFNASWFILTMGTGVVVQNLTQFPYPAGWIDRLAYCFWVLDMALFLFFSGMSITRLVMFPQLSKAFYQDFIQTSYLGAVPITLDTIVYGIIYFYNDRPTAIWTAYGLWWLAIIVSLFVGSLVVVVVCAYQEAHELNAVTGVWLLTFIPFIVSSGTGANLVQYLPTTPAIATLVVSYLSWAVGILMAHLIIGILLYRLVACRLPAREAIVSCFIPMGPPGMGAYSIQLQAMAFSSILKRTNFLFSLPSFGTAPAIDATGRHIIAQSVHWFGVLIGLFFAAESTFWMIFAITAVGFRVPKTFVVGMWSFVFPCGVYTNALEELARNFRNGGFRGYAAFMTVVTLLLWVGCAACTVYKSVWRAQLMFAPGLEGWNERMAMQEMHDRSREALGTPKAPKDINDSQRTGQRPSPASVPSSEDISLNRDEMILDNSGRMSNTGQAVARVSRPDGSYSLAKWRRKRLPV